MKKRILLLLAAVLCVSLCACGGSETSSGNNVNTQKEESSGLFQTEKEVEITMDNWQEYFEEKDIVTTIKEYNSFDELVSERFFVTHCLVLKNGYEINVEKSKVAIEYKVYSEKWSVDIDTDSLDVSFVEKISDDSIGNSDDLFEEFEMNETTYYGIEDTTGKASDCGEIYSDNTVIRRLFEISRIQGTIYIKEK